MRRALAIAAAAACIAALPSCRSVAPTQAAGRPSSLARPSPPAATSTPSPSPAAASDATGIRVRTPAIRIWQRPARGSRAREMVAHNPMGQQLVFLVDHSVVRDGRTWFRILLPRRPNGSTAWVPLGPGLRVVPLRQRVDVDLSTFTLTRYRDGVRVARYRVGIGQPQWPTPVGTFYVWAHVPQPSPAGPYGAYAIGLSGFSPVLTEWPGGGRFAIHGTPFRSDLGRKVSHGCIRVYNPQVLKLRSLPMGTPVVITR